MARTKHSARKSTIAVAMPNAVRVRKAGDLNDAGRLFVTVNAAAERLGLSLIMITMHLADTEKYPDVEGYVFEWAEERASAAE